MNLQYKQHIPLDIPFEKGTLLREYFANNYLEPQTTRKTISDESFVDGNVDEVIERTLITSSFEKQYTKTNNQVRCYLAGNEDLSKVDFWSKKSYSFILVKAHLQEDLDETVNELTEIVKTSKLL
jgi:hypothetical protein